jgi:hypothetical protein
VVAAELKVHRRMVQQALASAEPPERKPVRRGAAGAGSTDSIHRRDPGGRPQGAPQDTKAMGVARSNLVEQLKPSGARQRRPPPDDQWLLPMVRAILAEHASRAAQSPASSGGLCAG